MAKMSDLNVGWRHLIWAETSAHAVRFQGLKRCGQDVYKNVIIPVPARTTPSRIGCHMGTRQKNLAKAPLLGPNEQLLRTKNGIHRFTAGFNDFMNEHGYGEKILCTLK